MKANSPSWATIVVATHSNTDSIDPPFVIGFGLLSVKKTGRDDWSFALHSAVADTLADEPSILTRLADSLPQPDFLISERIDARVFAPLDAAAGRADPVISAHMRHRIARLGLALPIDLAAGHARRPGPLPYAETLPVTPPIAIEIADDAIIDVERARAELEHRVIDGWLRFLRVPLNPGYRFNGGSAAIATITWMTSRGFA